MDHLNKCQIGQKHPNSLAITEIKIAALLLFVVDVYLR